MQGLEHKSKMKSAQCKSRPNNAAHHVVVCNIVVVVIIVVCIVDDVIVVVIDVDVHLTVGPTEDVTNLSLL